jgi:hypothetical protein
LGLRFRHSDNDVWVFQLPDGSKVEVFGLSENKHFTTGSVVEFFTDDVAAATEELRAAGPVSLTKASRAACAARIARLDSASRSPAMAVISSAGASSARGSRCTPTELPVLATGGLGPIRLGGAVRRVVDETAGFLVCARGSARVAAISDLGIAGDAPDRAMCRWLSAGCHGCSNPSSRIVGRVQK